MFNPIHKLFLVLLLFFSCYSVTQVIWVKERYDRTKSVRPWIEKFFLSLLLNLHRSLIFFLVILNVMSSMRQVSLTDLIVSYFSSRGVQVKVASTSKKMSRQDEHQRMTSSLFFTQFLSKASSWFSCLSFHQRRCKTSFISFSNEQDFFSIFF